MRGLDIGTMNIVHSQKIDDRIVRNRYRDAFIDCKKEALFGLTMKEGQDYIEREHDILLLGDQAMRQAAAWDKECRRPLKQGLISPDEQEGIQVLAYMIKNLLGVPRVPNELVCFSIPGSPIDHHADTIYHEQMFSKIIQECGFTAEPTNEALAIIFSNGARSSFSALSFSFGSGMTNICMAIDGIENEEMMFSVARGGDWIDSRAGYYRAQTSSAMCSIKERADFDLLKPGSDDHEALSFYYKGLISYALDKVASRLRRSRCILNAPMPILISGGTAKAKGFLDLFKAQYERKKHKFGSFPISDIRLVVDPLNAVADGLLTRAIQMES